MEGIWSMLDNLQSMVSKFQASRHDLAPSPPEKAKLGASSSRAQPEHVVLPRPLRQLNDYVFEVCTPAPPRRPSVEIIFFHGLQLEGSQEAHISTWVSRDGSELWLHWILNDFPDARILTISYDAHARRTGRGGYTDGYIIGENLVHSLTQLGAHVGQDGCPVVLVGHCIGGLVMKELCLQAHSMLSLDIQSNIHVNNFLHNLKGLFFYATPHHGTRLADRSTRFVKGPLFEDVTTNNTEAERRNENFRKLRRNYGWRTSGVGEAYAVTLGRFNDILVTEASARYDVDDFYLTNVDHFEICQPHSTISSTFVLLSKFVVGIVKEDNVQHGAKIEFSNEVVDHQGQVKTILKKLEKAPRLAICGMGGIGKTTLAKMVYNKISGEFDYTCFVEEVKKLIGTMTPKDLQIEITKRLYAKDRKVDETFEWSTLQGKSVLVILDDVNLESQVQVMIEADGFSHDSRVVVTSRDREFLIPEDFEFYFAKQLDDDDSKRLFCLHAFKMANSPKDYEDLVLRFSKKCGGLPLALKVVGRYLYKRSKHLWDDALEKLSRAEPLNGNIEDGLWSIIKMSYYSLATSEQEMFLDVAVVFHGEELQQAKEIWRACGWAADSGWDNLVDKGLVKSVHSWSNSKEEDSEFAIIQMHEMLRDLGRNIACPDPQNILSHTRVSYNLISDISTWPFNQGDSKVKVLKIFCWDDLLTKLFLPTNLHVGPSEVDISAPPTEVDINVFHELHELKVLLIDAVFPSRLYGACYSFPHNLVYLGIRHIGRWIESSSRLKQTSSPKVEQNQTLRHLRIERCSLESLPKSLGNFRALERLTISDCYGLIALPDSIGKLQALKVLTIRGCNLLKGLPDSLGALQALKVLTVVDCEKISAFPNSLCKLRALEQLRIGCRVFPKSLGQLQALKHLTLEASEDRVPVSVPNDLLGRFPDLRALNISRICLPDTLGEHQALRQLVLEGCSGLACLPRVLKELTALEYLHISNDGDYYSCPVEMEDLSDSVGRLQALKHLTLENLYGWESLPDSLGELKALEYLKIIGIDDLNSLPDSLGQQHALKELILESCDDLQYLPDNLGQCESLHLTIINCGCLEDLPDTLGQIKSLVLTIEGCERLKDLPESLKRRGFSL